MKRKNKNLLLAIGFIYILISLAYFLGTSYTGYVIFEESYMLIDFLNESEYIYDNNTIDLTSSARLIPDVEIRTITEEILENSYVISALKYKKDDEEDDGKDVTDKIIALDNISVNIEKEQNENTFNVYFDKNLTDSDIIRFFIYTVGNVTAGKVYLCETNYTCTPPGYGEVNINDEGWYNITVMGLNRTADSFNIDPEKIKFDYIDALHKKYNVYNVTDVTYPLIGIIETQNIFINGSLGNVIINQTLNNQTANYYYSIDNENYNQITANLSHINNTQIKFKIELVSDATNTPIVHDLKIDFIPNPPKNNIEQPPASGGSSGGGGGGSSGGSKKEIAPETPVQTKEVITTLEELQAAKSTTEPKIIKKTESEMNLLQDLTGKATYSSTNILNFLKSNLWVLIFLIALIIIYLILYIERHKIHKSYKQRK